MRRRAEHVDRTRRRITEAAVHLHTTVGPANTSMSAVADEAGVTRLTLYRHFPDADRLFAACFGHWRAANPPPDPGRWAGIADLEARARRAIGELYAWYRSHADALYPIHRDFHAMPASTRGTMEKEQRGMVALLLAGSAAGGAAARRQRAAAGHVLSFATWHSFALEQGLTDAEATDLAVRLILAAAARGA